MELAAMDRTLSLHDRILDRFTHKQFLSYALVRFPFAGLYPHPDHIYSEQVQRLIAYMVRNDGLKPLCAELEAEAPGIIGDDYERIAQSCALDSTGRRPLDPLESSTDISMAEVRKRSELRELLFRRCRKSELNCLADDIGIDHESLTQTDKRACVLDLVTQAAHQLQIPLLVSCVRQQRPDLSDDLDAIGFYAA
jgi:hypothetical protein